ncbi:MAG: alpha/beta hydrolase fold domain-containing protein, partial [Dehalococcoidia bacterium]
VALMARDRGGPRLLHQLLVYPVLGYDFATDSYERNAKGYGLTRNTMVWYWEQYLNSPSEAQDPYAAPLSAPSLSGLPPALVITAEFDPLLDEGRAYAERLANEGVVARHSMYEGTIHAFFNATAPLDGTSEAIAEATAALRTAFAT